MTKWKQGQSGNPNGRPKRGQEKSAVEIRNELRQIISDELQMLPERLQEMKGMPYVTVRVP